MIYFHRFLIGTAILFCGFFSIWTLSSYLGDKKPVSLALFLGFAAATAALAYYLKNLKRFLKL